MQMAFLPLCALAIAAVVLLSKAYGRAIATVAAATCWVSVAVAMPPAFSLAVDRLADQATLAVYGVLSLLVLVRRPRKEHGPRADAAAPPARREEPRSASRASLSDIVHGIAARPE